MTELLPFIVWTLMAYWCYTIARKKGRSKVLAVFMGLLFGLVAVIVYAIIRPTEEVQLENAKKLLEK